MDLRIALVGLNHRTASVDVRERFSLADCHSPENWGLPCHDGLVESLILSTCNRVELLGVGADSPHLLLLDRWRRITGAKERELAPHVYQYLDLEAVRHVFQVASSLDSMVLGEPQILGQLKSAYRDAVNSHSAGSILNRLMHNAFYVAKRVRTETSVAASAVSISYAAVELAKRIFGNMADHKAMLLGAGEMAELAATHLLRAGIDELIVVNRTMEHGLELASHFHGQARPFESLVDSLEDVDIVIASTGSRDPVVNAKDVKKALKARKNRPMFFIDIAVPRDIDTDVNTLDNVYLYDIDDLKEVIEENLAGRRQEAEKAALIVDGEVKKFAAWLESLEARPTIVDLVKRGERAAAEELERTLRHVHTLDAHDRHAIEVMANALARKLNHEPIMYLKEHGMGHEGQLGRINMVRRIFNLDKDGYGKS